jgi:DNA polymerase III epsilon subunit-like protein
MDFVPEALSISGLSMADLTATGIPAQVAMVEFRDWIANVSSGRAPVFVGFNAVFDWCFINWYFHKFLRANPFGFGGIDIKSYYMGLTGATWEQSRSSRLKDEYQPEHQQTHNALDDARSQAEIFHKMLQTEQQRRASP